MTAVACITPAAWVGRDEGGHVRMVADDASAGVFDAWGGVSGGSAWESGDAENARESEEESEGEAVEHCFIDGAVENDKGVGYGGLVR
jgi:hypothetical protein